MYYVYAIQSLRLRNDVERRRDVERRIEQHNKGQNRSTKAYLPFKLIYTEVCKTRIEAR